jgi:hypothetical protein
MNTFATSINLSLVDRVSPALAHIAQSMTKTTGAAAMLQKRLDKIGSLYSSGKMMIGAGMALASPLISATKSAMELETAMGRVKMATGASNSQMAELNKTLTTTANQTAIFSKPKLAQFAAEMYAGGIRSMGQINSMLPAFAKAADVLKITSGGKIGPEQTIHSLTALSHQFGRYSAEEMRPIIETAVAMSKSLPGGMKTLAGMGSYVNIMGNRALGIDPVQLMAAQAAVAQTSGGTGTGRGALSGANLANFLKRSMPGVFGSGLLSGKSAWAAATIGLGDSTGASTAMKNGKLDLELLQQKISKFEGMTVQDIAKTALAHVGMLGKKAGEEIPLLKKALALGEKGVSKSQLITQLFQDVYGSASTIAMLMGEKKFLGVEQNLANSARDAIKNGGIEAMQAKAMEMLEPQLMRLQTNLGTLGSTIGTQLIPVITPIVKTLGDIVDKATEFASANPKIVQAASGLLAVASGALILGGAANIAAAGFIGLKFVLPLVTKGLGPLGLALTAVGLIWDHWSDVMNVVRKNSDLVINVMADVAWAMDYMGIVCSKLVGVFFRVGRQLAGLIGSIPGGGQAGESINKWLQDLTAVGDQRFNEKYLRSKGMGGIVDYVKGGPVAGQVNTGMGAYLQAVIAASAASKSAPITQHNTYSPTINVNTTTSPEELKAMLNKEKDNFANYTVKKLAQTGGHRASASSGNSVGRSIFNRGSGRS